MCFKTASLPAPSENKARVIHAGPYGVNVSVIATGTREVSLHFGSGKTPSQQYAGPDDLRELAAEFTKLADQLEA